MLWPQLVKRHIIRKKEYFWKVVIGAKIIGIIWSKGVNTRKKCAKLQDKTAESFFTVNTKSN